MPNSVKIFYIRRTDGPQVSEKACSMSLIIKKVQTQTYVVWAVKDTAGGVQARTAGWTRNNEEFPRTQHPHCYARASIQSSQLGVQERHVHSMLGATLQKPRHRINRRLH